VLHIQIPFYIRSLLNQLYDIMEGINFLVLALAALIPMAVGAIYYGPLFGKKWMSVNGFTEEDLKGGNMVMIMGLSLLFSFFLSFSMMTMAIHQTGVFQLLGALADGGDAAAKATMESFMADYGTLHRTFGHGVLHGGFAAVMFALPLIAINSLFERRGWTYIGIHFGYWFITLSLMGGVICKFF